MNRKLIKICSVLMALSLLMLTFAACGGGKEFVQTGDVTKGETEKTTNASDASTTVVGNVNPLTGLEISKDALGKRPIAIMVENTPDARPQWGLSTPDIVIEGLVEGGITRMMWVYADVNSVPKVGPVRSARHDYVEIAAGMNAIYAHWGGSKPYAYDTISKLGVDSIDGTTYGTNSDYKSGSTSTFFKDNSRTNVSTEHRGYTNGTLLATRISSKKIDTKATGTSWTPFNVIQEGVRYAYGEDSGNCNTVNIVFSSSYTHQFKYNAEQKLYYNYMNGKAMMDGNTNTQMAVTNVIIMYCDTKTMDDKGRQDWDLTSGDAVFISHGYGEAIRWEKKSASAPLEFFSKKSGEKLVVNKGQTWIGIVPEKNRTLTDVEG